MSFDAEIKQLSCGYQKLKFRFFVVFELGSSLTNLKM